MNSQPHLMTTNIPKYSSCTYETLLYIQQHPEAKAILHLAMRDGRNSLFTRNCPTRPEILRGSDILFRWCDAIKNLGPGKRAREKFRDEATASAVKNALQILVTELWCPMSASVEQLRAVIHGGVRNGKGVLTSALKQARFVISEIREDIRIPFDETRLFPSKLIQLPELHSLANYSKHEEEVVSPTVASAIGAPVRLQEMTLTDSPTVTHISTTTTPLPLDFNSWSRLELGSHKELTPTASSFSIPSPPLLTFLRQPAVPHTSCDGPRHHPATTVPVLSPKGLCHPPTRSLSFTSMSIPRSTLQEEEKDIATLLLLMKDQSPSGHASLSDHANTQRSRSHSQSCAFDGKYHHHHADTDLNEAEEDDSAGGKVNPHYVTCGSSPYLLESFPNDDDESNCFEPFMSMMIQAGYATHLLSDPTNLDEWILKVIFLMNYELVASESCVLFHRKNFSPCTSNQRHVFHLVSSPSLTPTSCSCSHKSTGIFRICYGDYDANDILFPRTIALKILEKLRRCGEIKRRPGNDGGESEWKEMVPGDRLPANKRLKYQ